MAAVATSFCRIKRLLRFQKSTVWFVFKMVAVKKWAAAND